MRTLLPEGWPRPKGYANGIAVEGGRTIYVAGQIGWDETGAFPHADFAGQFRQTLLNTLAVLKAGGAGPEHVVRMTWFIVDKHEYLASLKAIGAAWRELMGPNYPAMSVVQVTALIEDAAKVEIETTAVVGGA
jgi:enamine deaminase RidA (YjgF/YER057c/UK114 family)